MDNEYYNTTIVFNEVKIGEMFSYRGLAFCKVEQTSDTFANSIRVEDRSPVYFFPYMTVEIHHEVE